MTTNPAVEIDLDKQRAEFEAWAREEWPDGSLEGANTSGGWYYFDDVLNDFWICWKAAQARASQAVAEPSREWVQTKWIECNQDIYAFAAACAAPVAQQSEAGSQDRRALELENAALIAAQPSDITPKGWERHEAAINATSCALHKPVGAGAPTAAAELGIGFSNNDQGVHVSVMQKHADSTFTVLHQAKVPTGDSFARVFLGTPTSGRESAAPEAQQDAKRLFRTDDFGVQWEVTPEQAAQIDAMQKGAQDNA